MKRKYCSNCIFWEAETMDDDTAGICRRHAPRPRIIDDPDATSRTYYSTLPMWPQVMQLEWCGEWRSRK
jgi:hypothetical protein